MIADAITLNNELDILEIRLETLNPLVDKFVIVEAELTQTLLPKPLHFSLNSARFERYKDKIVHIAVKAEECPENDSNPWNMENFQRNCIARGLARCGMEDGDVVLIGDCDEIPRPEALEKTVFGEGMNLSGGRHIKLDHPISFVGSFNAYFLNLHAPDKEWVGTAAVPRSMLHLMSPQEVRNSKDFFDRVEGAWHFSYCSGGIEGVWSKYRSTIEPISKDCLFREKEDFRAFFNDRVLRRKRFIYMDRRDDMSVALAESSFDDLPECVKANPGKYGHMLFKEGMSV